MGRTARCWLRILLTLGAFGRVDASDQVEALFIVVGDQHSAYARTAQFVAHVDRVKAENPSTPIAILINGDSFEYGNVVARRSAGAVDFAMFAALARRGPTILNLGNHEPEFHEVAALVERVRATGVVVIGNLKDRATGELYAPAATQLRLGRAEVVIAGIGTDTLAQYRAAIQPTLDLSDPAIWAKEKFPRLLSQAPVKIVLSHVGLKQDRGVFEFLPDSTLIAGAHDHTQYVEQTDRMTYFHSGSWNSHLSEVQLKRPGGTAQWKVSQRAIRDDDPRDVELMEVIRTTEKQHLSPEDLRVIGRTDRALILSEAARYVVQAVHRAIKVDAVFIGNTTFGGGLPGGEVTDLALDACVRFDGKISIAEITGDRLRSLLRQANQDAATPFRERKGEFQFAEGPSEIAAGQTYRIATTDWGVRNRARYFGTDEIAFVEQPNLRLKAIVAAALAQDAAK